MCLRSRPGSWFDCWLRGACFGGWVLCVTALCGVGVWFGFVCGCPEDVGGGVLDVALLVCGDCV